MKHSKSANLGVLNVQQQGAGGRFLSAVTTIGLLSLVFVADVSSARDACVDKSVVFDGIQPLTYHQVKANPGEKVYIFKDFDNVCRPSQRAACQTPYIIKGDTVAVAKTCGSRAFVQYIGLNSITIGWVETKSLEPWSPPYKDEIPSVFGGPEAAIGREQFKLTVGNGQPVCEAYLQRLNKTLFGPPSYCGRPENSAVPGFERLNRQYLSTKEINEIADTGASERFSLATWRYNPPIDVDNDGLPDNVLMWNLDDPQEPHCGLNSGGSGGEDTGFQLALIMASDNKSVDSKRTLQTFGNADPQTAESITIPGSNSAKSLLYKFPAFGTSYGLFRYHNITYFDTYTGHERNPITGDTEPAELWVFLRRNHRTSRVCAIH